MAVRELADVELRYLGPNIKALDNALTNYWHVQYPQDPMKRVYVVYFFESAFPKPPEAHPYHLHVHIIPRFERFDAPDRLRYTADGVSWVDG